LNHQIIHSPHSLYEPFVLVAFGIIIVKLNSPLDNMKDNFDIAEELKSAKYELLS